MGYEFKTTPYKNQSEAFEASKDSEFFALFLEMGMGKSKVTIDTIGYLAHNNRINAALIFAPKGVFDNWVKKEIPAHLPGAEDYTVVRWQPNITKKFEREILPLVDPNRRDPHARNILVMNTEAMSTFKGQRIAELFVQANPNCLVAIDESTHIKNPKAERTKALIRIGRKAKYRRILTGSPVTKSPMDLYSQCDFLQQRALGFKSFYSFQTRYALMQRRVMGARSFNQIVGFQNLDELTETLSGFSLRQRKRDWLDLPAKIYMPPRKVELTKEQKTAYAQMKKLALARLESGEMVTTQSVLTQIMRLQQIVCGSVTTDEGDVKSLPNNRIKELLNIVEESDGKILIWAHFTHDIRAIHDALSNEYGTDSVATYYGATKQADRQRIIETFQDPDSGLRFFVGQPSSGGYGITLTEANTVVYYSNGYNLEHRLQSEDRAHRIGQDAAVTYVDLVCEDTIDEKILGALRSKVNLAGEVLGEDVKDWLT